MDTEKNTGMNRRNFAKSTAAASFAILSAKSGVAETNSDTLKYGLIGCGGRGTGAAKNMLDGCENVQIVAMADLFEDRLKNSRSSLERLGEAKHKGKVNIQDDHCFVGVDAYQKLLETDVDVIIHGTTPYIRPTHIMAAAEAGKHIFTEKPAAVDAPGIRLFMEASKLAEKKGLSLVAGTQRRHQKSYVDTMEKILNGEIGDIQAARAYWCGTLPFVKKRNPDWSDLEYQIRNWYAHCWVCGDNIVEQHVHNLDVINWAMDAHPVSAFASGGRAWKPRTEDYGDHYDHFSVDYEYENGVHLMSLSRHYENSDGGVFEEVTGTKGVSTCRDMGKDNKDPYVLEHMDHVASIRGEIPYLNEGVRVAESTFTAILGRDAAYSGQKLKWDDHLKNGKKITWDELDFSKEYPLRDIPIPGTYEA